MSYSERGKKYGFSKQRGWEIFEKYWQHIADSLSA
jgi:hypothetical protein